MNISQIRRYSFVAVIALLACSSGPVSAQDDANETPLGDVARSLRKKVPDQPVIDNDNLPAVMQQAEVRHLAGNSLQYSIDNGGKTFQVSSPDVNCRLSFTANSKALLATQYTQMQLPPSELAKLAGPATIDGSSLTVSIFNGSDWHVSELAVALTLIPRTDSHDSARAQPSAKLIPASETSAVVPDKPDERSADITTLFRMRAAAAPTTTTLFQAPLNFEIGPDQEWHWAIVEAKGYPPQHSTAAQAAALPATQ